MFSLARIRLSSRFDYIIVGGGSAGCVLASHLSRKGKTLLLEAGSNDSNPIWTVPLLSIMYGVLLSKKYNWRYYSEPEPFLNHRRIYQPRGKVMGGSGTINGMIWVRGHPEDYNRWAEMSGDPSWRYDKFKYYLSKIETAEVVGDNRGKDGKMQVSRLAWQHPLSNTFLRACEQYGLPVVEDFHHDHNTRGSGFYEMAQKCGARVSTRQAYLKEPSDNLTVVCSATVDRIVLEGTKAVGVKWNGDHTAYADGEIILASGVFGSPQILMLSGIGPPDHLAEHDITCAVPRQGVGHNLLDHLDVGVQFENPSNESLGMSPWMIPLFARAPFSYLFGGGVMTSNGVDAGGYMMSDGVEDGYENIQLHFFPGSFRDYKIKGLFGHYFALNAYLSRPFSSGTVRLKSSNPSDHVELKFNFLADERDRKALISAVRKAREIILQPAFDGKRGNEVGSTGNSDEDILQFLASNCKSAHHPVGTCRMGRASDSMAVVDGKLRVLGVDNLRVADASVFPTHTTSNPYQSVIALAEKCAEDILNL